MAGAAGEAAQAFEAPSAGPLDRVAALAMTVRRASANTQTAACGDFLVALVIAAVGDEFACDGELRERFLQQPRGLGEGAQEGRGRSAARRLRGARAQAARAP